MKRIIFSLVTLFTCVFAQSQIFDVNGIYYRIIEDTTANATNGMIAAVTTMGDADHYQGSVSIPSTVSINGTEYTVGAIMDMAFKGSNKLSSITIPASVTQIPSGAFYGCSNLSTITVESGNSVYDSREECNAVIETATNTVIAGCKNTVFPSSVSTIGECAFYGCTGMTSLTIPANIREIDSWAFLDCTDLLALNFPASVKSIGTAIFLGCNNIETLDWNSRYSPSIAVSDSYASLKNVVLGDSVTYLSPYAFSNCRALESVVFSPNLKTIERYAFKDCKSLKSFTFPAGIQRLSYDAFEGCDNIETVYWNHNDSIAMSRILGSAASSIKKVIIGPDITCIEGQAFWNFTNLTSISVDPDNKVYDSRNDCNAVIEKETNTLVVGCKTTTIPEGVTRLEQYAFRWCGGPESITLPSSLTSIGSYAFTGCYELSSLTIPKNVIEIGEGITSYCSNLTSLKVDPENQYFSSPENCNVIIVNSSSSLIAGCATSVIPSGVKHIGDWAFEGCSGLTAVSMPSGLTDIGLGAFSGSGLITVDISKDVTSIEDYAFSNCNRLTSIISPFRMEKIGRYAFQGCSSLHSFTVPQGVKVIEQGLFYNCDTIISIDIPSSVDSIGRNAFYGCRALKSLIIPEGVTLINDGTFYGCESLEYLSIPSTATLFGRDIYTGCMSLKTAGPKGGCYNFEFNWMDTIPANAFYTLYYLESVYIPKTIKAVYEYSFPYEGIRSDYQYPSAVFYSCRNLKSVSVSFSDTKLMRYRYNRLTGYEFFEESQLDYNLYKTNKVESLTLLDDTVKTLTGVLTDQIKEIVISGYVKDIYPGALSFEPYSVVIENYYGSYYNSQLIVNVASEIKDIKVEGASTGYSSINGVLFNKDGSKLLAYPGGRDDGYRIPTSTTSIANYAFSNCKLTDVSIPNSITQIYDRAFEGCDSLTEVIIEGAPVIGHYAFDGCRNIQSVRTRSAVPGLMELSESPQTIMTGDCNSLAIDGAVNPEYNTELGRTVSLINNNRNLSQWAFSINTYDIPSGTYKVSIGILPSPDNMLNMFHPLIRGIKENGEQVTLLDPVEDIPVPPFVYPIYYFNDGNAIITYDTVMYRPPRYRVETNVVYIGYDSVLLADSLVIPEGIKQIRIEMEIVSNNGTTYYASSMLLDRVFFEPVGDDMPVQRYAGPFTENVFNDATLYVPEGTVDTYRNAKGWKLFRNIEVDTKVYPSEEIEVTITDAGYATFYYSDGDYMLPKGLTAMVVSDLTPEGRIVYTTIADGADNGIIPAGTAVVLATDNKQAGVFKLQLTSGNYRYYGENLLIGTDVATTTYAAPGSVFYKLSYGPANTALSGVPGWYWAAPDGGAFSIDAHKAWLVISKSLANGTRAFSLEGNPTFVNQLQSDTEKIELYDLYGRRISAPSGNGIFIRNGKKVVVIE